MIKKSFGILPDGQEAFLYTISCGQIQAQIIDCGTTVATIDCPGMQLHKGNLVESEQDKYGVSHTYRGGIALEAQYSLQ